MFIIEAVQSSIIALLVGYLSLTNTLSEHIMGILPSNTEIPATTSAPLTPETSSPSNELVSLSRLYASTQGVAQVLRGNSTFQDALNAVGQEAAALEGTLDSVSEEMVSNSLVNIVCEYHTDTHKRMTTGTGFFIDSKGVILTNAHVAQFLLLEGTDTAVQDTECTIRSGNPAVPTYRAELLFISPTWILNNASLITDETPRGTGEYDYALLYVSDTLNGTALPESFPAVRFNDELLSSKLTRSLVFTAGYPAEKLLREGADAQLEPKVARTYIAEMYTFGSSYADIFSVSSSPVGEHGASGGPIVHPELGAIGIIVTKGDRRREGENSLRALTLSYINRTITEETGYSLGQNLRGNLPNRGGIFKEALAPFLTDLLNFELD